MRDQVFPTTSMGVMSVPDCLCIKQLVESCLGFQWTVAGFTSWPSHQIDLASIKHCDSEIHLATTCSSSLGTSWVANFFKVCLCKVKPNIRRRQNFVILFAFETRKHVLRTVIWHWMAKKIENEFNQFCPEHQSKCKFEFYFTFPFRIILVFWQDYQHKDTGFQII